MDDMGLTFTPALVRCLVVPLGLSGPMTSTSWTHSYSKQSYWNAHLLIRAIHDITVVVKKLLKIHGQ